MSVLDYVIIIIALLSVVIGAIKGILRPIFGLIGFFVVLYLGGSFTSLINGLLDGIITQPDTCSFISMIASIILVSLLYAIITRIIIKIIDKNKVFGKLNHLLGGVFGFVVVYLVLAVVVAFMSNDSQMFASLQEKFGSHFDNSWIVTHVYAKNPIGEGLVESAFQKIIAKLESALPK